MTAADSLVTRLRTRLACLIEPKPAPGQAWCIGCAFHDGQTWAMPAYTALSHVQKHRDGPPEDRGVRIKIAYAVKDLS